MIQKITDKGIDILDTAERLFEANGFHATGVDHIAIESGVTKRTLYKHFGSKEGLIEAVLSRHHSNLMNRIRTHIAKIETPGGAQLLACFDLYHEWFDKPHFAGCLFIKTLNEFQQCSERLFVIASRAKFELRNYLAELSKKAGAKHPELLANQLQLVLEGSIIIAQCGRVTESIHIAREMAEKLIAEELNEAPASD